MTNGIPNSPTDSEMRLSSSPRRCAKGGNNRVSQKPSVFLSHDHGGRAVGDRKHRVWKACERCRTKKTKCDGEYPCRRCKEDGMVCTTGCRKKKELQQLPTGYVEVLESTHYALTATVEKLYAMVKNGESWDLEDPEINHRGQLVIHSIAEKLGCLRPSGGAPNHFLADAEGFAELQALMKVERSDEMEGIHFADFASPPQSTRTARESSSESEQSNLLEEYMKTPLGRQQQLQQHDAQLAENLLYPTAFAQEPATMAEESAHFNLQQLQQLQPSAAAYPPDSQVSAAPQSQPCSYSLWSDNDDFLTPAHMLQMSALYLQSEQLLRSHGVTAAVQGAAGSMNPASLSRAGSGSGLSRVTPSMNMADGTIKPHMLHRDSGYFPAGQGGNIMFDNYSGRVAEGLVRGVSLFA